MGRAIVRQPRVFLFDEPLSNLDAKLRVQMRTEIKKIHQRLQTTVVYVTHDQIEAMTLADRIVVMNHGVIEQVGTPDDMYNAPRTQFVASFIGSPSMNFAPCHLDRTAGGLSLRLGGDVSLSVPAGREDRYAPFSGRDLLLGIRPEHVTNRRTHSHADFEDFGADIKVVEPMGMDTMVFFDIGEAEICSRCEPKSVSGVGDAMGFTIDKSQMHLSDPNSEMVL